MTYGLVVVTHRGIVEGIKSGCVIAGREFVRVHRRLSAGNMSMNGDTIQRR